jgi:deoxynucleotide monophosphate kinase-like protein
MAQEKTITLIGISGRIGSGKDTLAKMLQYHIVQFREHGQFMPMPKEIVWIGCDWKIKKFADKLKDMVCLLIGCTRAQLEDQDFKSSFLPPEWDSLIFNWSLESSPVRLPATEPYLSKFPDTKRKQMTVREMLQRVGTDCMRDHLHANTWVNALFADYNPIPPFETSKWIITDMRFPNELTSVQARGGITIRISRGIIEQYQKGNPVQKYLHPSETALDSYVDSMDEYVKNTGSLSDLYEIAKSIVTKYKLA